MNIVTAVLAIFLLLAPLAQTDQETIVEIWVYFDPNVIEISFNNVDFDSLLEDNAERYDKEINVDHIIASRDKLGIIFEVIDNTKVRAFFATPVTTNHIREQSPILYTGYSGYGIVFEPDDEEAWNVISSLTMALGVYTSGDCEDAIKIIDDSREPALNARLDFVSFLSISNFYKGNCWLTLEQYDKAIQSFEALRSLLIKNRTPHLPAELQVNLAWAYLKNNRIESAQDLISNLLERHDYCLSGELCTFGETQEIADLYARRAQFNSFIANYDAAISDMNAAIGQNTQNPELYILRGQMYLNLYEWDKSLEDFNTAIELDPDYAEAYFQRGVLYYSILQTGQELREEALADFRHYLELAPDGPYAEQAADYAQTIEAELAALNQ